MVSGQYTDNVSHLATNIVNIVGVHTHEAHAGQVAEEDVLGLDLETRVVVEGDPLVAEEGVGAGEVLVPLQGPVTHGEKLTNLKYNLSIYSLV